MSNKKWTLKPIKKTTASNKEILVSLLCGLMAFPLFILPLWYIAKWQNTKVNEAIDNNPGYTMCIITNKHPHKGKSVDIECFINEKKHYYRESVSPEYYRTLKIGQEIAVKYCKDDTSLATVVEP